MIAEKVNKLISGDKYFLAVGCGDHYICPLCRETVIIYYDHDSECPFNGKKPIKTIANGFEVHLDTYLERKHAKYYKQILLNDNLTFVGDNRFLYMDRYGVYDETLSNVRSIRLGGEVFTMSSPDNSQGESLKGFLQDSRSEDYKISLDSEEYYVINKKKSIVYNDDSIYVFERDSSNTWNYTDWYPSVYAYMFSKCISYLSSYPDSLHISYQQKVHLASVNWGFLPLHWDSYGREKLPLNLDKIIEVFLNLFAVFSQLLFLNVKEADALKKLNLKRYFTVREEYPVHYKYSHLLFNFQLHGIEQHEIKMLEKLLIYKIMIKNTMFLQGTGTDLTEPLSTEVVSRFESRRVYDDQGPVLYFDVFYTPKFISDNLEAIRKSWFLLLEPFFEIEYCGMNDNLWNDNNDIIKEYRWLIVGKKYTISDLERWYAIVKENDRKIKNRVSVGKLLINVPWLV